MLLHETIKNQIKDAMRAKDEIKLEVLRGLNSLFMNELIAKKSAEPFLADSDVMILIKRSVKQRKDSIEQFEKGNRQDLANKEKKELVILESYMPKAMPKEEILKIAQEKKASLGINDKAKIGILMGAVMKETKGLALGNDVKEVVEGLF